MINCEIVGKIKELNNEIIKKMLKELPSFNIPVDYKSSCTVFEEGTIAEKARYPERIEHEFGDFDVWDYYDDGIKISQNKIEFFKEGSPNGLSISIKDKYLQISFSLADRLVFTEQCYDLDCLGKFTISYSYNLSRVNETFMSKRKIKNLIEKNYIFFKEAIDECNILLSNMQQIFGNNLKN